MISKEILHVLANFWIYFVWFYYARFFKLIFFPKMHIGVWSYITVMILLSFWSVWFSLHWHCAVFQCYFLSLFMTSVFYAKNVFNVFCSFFVSSGIYVAIYTCCLVVWMYVDSFIKSVSQSSNNMWHLSMYFRVQNLI